MKAIVRARADVEAGRLWKARDRLRGAFATAPTDQEVLDLLGEVLFEMGDLPEAGRHWLLTTRRDERTEAAIAALLERSGHRRWEFAASLPVRGELDQYPRVVQERLVSLRAAAIDEAGKNASLGWGRRPRPRRDETPSTWWDKAAGGIVVVVGLALLVAVVAGIASLAAHGVETLFSLLR